jgi:hypothetical protein
MKLTTEGHDSLGKVVAFAGDNDGDGFDDLLVTAYDSPSNYYAVLFSGTVSGAVVPADADATFDLFGSAPAGDIDGDGLDDVMCADDGVADAGAVTVFLGPVVGDVDSDAWYANIEGAMPGERAEVGVALGDVDGDGLGDIAIGAPGEADEGNVYLVLSPLCGTSSLDDAQAVFRGESTDMVGLDLAAGGDVDGDSRGDLLIGAPGDADGGEDAGAAFLVLTGSVL